MHSTISMFEKKNFRYILMTCLAAMLITIGMYAYLGTFSRYLADDYCETVSVIKDSPIEAVVVRYSAGEWRAANRYSNLLFVGIGEMLGRNNMQIMIVSMTLLWVVGLSWSAHEIRRFLNIDWFLSLDIFWGATLGFFSFLQAPNLFQTVYWRSSMATHFAPLVFGSFFAAFLVRCIRQLRTRPPSHLSNSISFLAALIIAGFSEPPATTMVTVLPLLMAMIWFLGKSPVKQKQLALLAWTFAGAFLGLVVMGFSPAGANIARERNVDFMAVLGNSFLYSYLFIIDSIKTIPLPISLSILIPLMLSWLYAQGHFSPLAKNEIYILLIEVLAILILMWLLIAAGFSPSVYGQNFPVERMRFLARTIMIAAFMLEGALFGILLKDMRFKYNQIFGQWMVLILFAVLVVVYPLRAALNIYRFDVPKFRTNAESWDVRDTQIRLAVEQGATDLVVVQLDSMGGVVEYKGNRSFWVNSCAARYYGLDSLIAP